MYRVAVVDDVQSASEHLCECLRQFGEENGELFNTDKYRDGMSFLDAYKNNKYDIVVLDIEMPGVDGLAVASALRKIDEKVLLIFITQMAQYAIRGYDVNAFDYIVKPYSYKNFALRMKKALSSLKSRTGTKLKLVYNGVVKIMDSTEVEYIEITGHDLAYHTTSGVYKSYGSLKDVEKDCPPSFVRCNSCYLVNLRFVSEVNGFEVTVGSDKLQISQPKRKGFMNALVKFLGATL